MITLSVLEELRPIYEGDAAAEARYAVEAAWCVKELLKHIVPSEPVSLQRRAPAPIKSYENTFGGEICARKFDGS